MQRLRELTGKLKLTGSPAQLVLRSYVVATKGLEDVNAASIRPHGGMDWRVLAVLLHEGIGGAEDVEVGDHPEAMVSIARSVPQRKKPYAAMTRATMPNLVKFVSLGIHTCGSMPLGASEIFLSSWCDSAVMPD